MGKQANRTEARKTNATSRPRMGAGDDPEYAGMLARIQGRFMERTAYGTLPVFQTDAADLFAVYLASFPDGPERQHHNCSACRHFLQRYGGLAVIGDDGRLESALWSIEDAPAAYAKGIAALERAVRRALIVGPFLSSEDTFGEPRAGDWQHFSVRPTPASVYRVTTITAGQAMAAKRHDYETVRTALGEFSIELLETALRVLRSDQMYRAEKVLGQGEWLHGLAVTMSKARGAVRDNIAWRAIATAPAGFCHPRASMIGTLLEDIRSGLGYEAVARRFAEKMHPLQYQRPQAPPTAGAIAQAEKVVQQLAAAGALARRFARPDEVRAIWQPRKAAAEPAKGGVFGHLQAKAQAPETSRIVLPDTTMTWVKFRDTVLPEAEAIEIECPANRASYSVLVTAVDPSATPLLQWDIPEARNPFSWYFWHGGSTPGEMSLVPGWVPVYAVAYKPPAWTDTEKFQHQGKALSFYIEGAKEARPNAGLALFPETLRSEFHGIRSVIEAYSRAGKLEGQDGPHAIARTFDAGERNWSCRLRVTGRGRRDEYRLDRWD